MEVGIPNKNGGPLRSRRLELMLSLPVDFDFYTWSAMFVMIATVSLVAEMPAAGCNFGNYKNLQHRGFKKPAGGQS